MGICVGIDLGTTFSAVAKINENTGKPEIIKNSYNNAITPSVLYFEPNGNILFGEDAKIMQSMGAENSVAYFKRNMGKDIFSVEINGNSYSATDLSAIFLSKLVKEAEECLGEKIDSAVITVPAYFTHKERQATIDAGEKIGLKVTSIINEPTAAALAYGLNGKEDEQTVLVYDLGGGTFDVTIARINRDKIDILGSDGNHELGGKDWDDCIARYIAKKFYDKHNVYLSDDDEMAVALLVKAENAKKQLTSMDIVNVPIDYKGIKENITITEEIFESITSFLLESTKEISNDLVESIGLTWNDISGTILVGGSTRMRMVHDYVKEISGKEPLKGVNVDEAVALGAAIKTNVDRANESFGMLGSSKCYASIGSKEISDVSAHALGMIAISEDGEKYINSTIIPKNTTIPAESRRKYNFRTRLRDNELEVYVLQGVHERPLDNTIINKYVITDIERTANLESEIEVSYKYTSDGVVAVSAVQLEINKTLPVRVEQLPEDMSWTDESPKEQIVNKPVSVEVLLAVDLSGSMSGEPLDKAQESMRDFVSQMDSKTTEIGLIIFADYIKLVTKPTKNYKKLLKDINKIDVGDVGICNKAEPFQMAIKTMLRLPNNNDSEKIRYLIVLTDGIWDFPEEAIKKAKKCHNCGVAVMALGFGDANEEFLKEIASTDDFASLTDLAELSSSFSKIAQVISEKNTGLRLM